MGVALVKHRTAIGSLFLAVGLSAAAAPFAFGIALLYYTVRAVGEILTRIDPHIVRRHFPV